MIGSITDDLKTFREYSFQARDQANFCKVNYVKRFKQSDIIVGNSCSFIFVADTREPNYDENHFTEICKNEDTLVCEGYKSWLFVSTGSTIDKYLIDSKLKVAIDPEFEYPVDKEGQTIINLVAFQDHLYVIY